MNKLDFFRKSKKEKTLDAAGLECKFVAKNACIVIPPSFSETMNMTRWKQAGQFERGTTHTHTHKKQEETE